MKKTGNLLGRALSWLAKPFATSKKKTTKKGAPKSCTTKASATKSRAVRTTKKTK